MAFDLSTAKPAGGGFDLSAAKAGPAPDATEEQKSKASVGSRILQGMRDPIDAGAQLLTHVLPNSVVNAGNAANNYIADKTGLVAPIPEKNLSSLVTGKTGGVDQMIADREAEYQAARTATGNKGIDWSRIAGNVVSPVNLAITAKIPQAVTLPGKLAAAVGTGATIGALSPVNDAKDFASEKAKQVATGAALGPASQLVGSAAARIVSPQTREAVTKLMEEGITPTPGQILGGRWQVLEDKLTSVPILGDAIASSRSKSLDELNIAAYKRVLEPIGGTVPKTAGRESVASVGDQVSAAYDKLLPKVKFQADKQFGDDITTLRDMASNLPEAQANRFEKVLRDQVIGKLSPNGKMDGETLKGIESELGTLSSGLKSDASFDNRQLGAAIGEIQASIRSALERANPQYAQELKAANTSWANYVRVRDAASRQGTDEGKFTPSQLSAAVRAQDKSRGKGNFAKGDALMQDLSDPAKSVLAPKYPDSGTAGRTMLGLGIGGGAAWLSPEMAATATAGIVPYLPGGRQAAAALLTKRPEGAKAVADAVKRLAPAISPAMIGVLK